MYAYQKVRLLVPMHFLSSLHLLPSLLQKVVNFSAFYKAPRNLIFTQKKFWNLIRF